MSKTTYIVNEVPGAKRTSDRPYTHAIVGRRNLALSREVVRGAENEKMLRSSWKHRSEMAAMKPGDLIHVQSYKPWSYPLDEAYHAESVAFIEKHPTPEAYVAHQVELGIAAINERGTGDAGELEVLQWSMSHKNAAAKVGSWSDHHVDVRVVECQAQEKPAKKAKPS